MTKKYDGFYFLPGREENELIFSFFEFGENLSNSKKIDSGNKIGDSWHIAFFTKDENGEPVFNDSFEAILLDPMVYVKNLCGTGIYGCVLRKTDKSLEWFNDYLDKVRNRVTIVRLKTS